MSRGHRIYTLAPTGITRHNVRHRLQGDPPSPQGEVLRETQPALGDSLRAQIIPSCVSGGEGNAEAHDWAPSLTHTKPRVRGLTTTRRPSSRRAAGPPSLPLSLFPPLARTPPPLPLPIHIIATALQFHTSPPQSSTCSQSHLKHKLPFFPF